MECNPVTNLGLTPMKYFEALFTDRATSDAHPYFLFHFNASLTPVSLCCVSEGELG